MSTLSVLEDKALWTAKDVAHLSKRLLNGRQLIVASNRAPYARARRGRREIWLRPAGGMAAALDPVLQATGGVWVAADVEGEGRLRYPADCAPPWHGRYRLEPVAFSAEEFAGYYSGYANSGLWPLCHMLVERARFSTAEWRAYQEANARFARAIARQARPGDLIWIQDYHLALCPDLVRRAAPGVRLAIFWHIPWPPYDVLRLCPQRRSLIRGLLAADVIGFHTEDFAANFMDCAIRELGAERLGGDLLAFGTRTIHVQPFPISIDYDRWHTLAGSRVTAKRAARLQHALGLAGQKVGVGVDRLDYTKGIVERLHAIETLFRRWPEYRGRVTFVQVAVPSRTALPTYQRLRRQVEEAVSGINHRFSRDGWRPIRYIGRLLDEKMLAALYRLADFAVVSSLYDGMNLVAKEFLACQTDGGPGSLLLSETAGAARELADAHIISPLDTDGMAEAMHEALETPLQLKAGLVTAWQDHLAEHNVYRWAADVITATARAG